MRLGLVGWCADTGLGYQNIDLWRHLPFERWLAPRHPRARNLQLPASATSCPRPPPAPVRDRFLQDIDTLFFCEQPLDPSILAECRRRGIRTACWVNHEWWPARGYDVDQAIAPVRYTVGVLEQLGVRAVHVPMAVDTEAFAFRQRGRVERWVFVNGYGGAKRRKGLGVVLEAARRSQVPGIVYTLRDREEIQGRAPAWVEVRQGPEDRSELYAEGEVCIQPSRWEGVGMQLLECQAAGMPLVTTAAPPMNEYEPLRTVGGARTTVCLKQRQTVATNVDPGSLAEVLVELHGADVSEASRRARTFVEQRHSWKIVAPHLLAVLEGRTGRS